MPCLKFFTNLAKNKIPANFSESLVPILSRTVGKPSIKFVCMINTDCTLAFNGATNKPTAVAILESIGDTNPMRNKEVSKEVSNYVFETLGITPENFLLTFNDIKSSNVGRAGTTVAELDP